MVSRQRSFLFSDKFKGKLNHIVFTGYNAFGFLNDYIGLYADSDKLRAISEFFVSRAYSAVITPTQIKYYRVAGASAGRCAYDSATLGIFKKYGKIFRCRKC